MDVNLVKYIIYYYSITCYQIDNDNILHCTKYIYYLSFWLNINISYNIYYVLNET